MISKRLRYEVLRRDNHRCRYCGRGADEARLVVDHVTPEALGGKSLPENLVAACADCNAGKASVAPQADLVADAAHDAIRWARAIEFAAEERARAWELIDETVHRFDYEWTGWNYGREQAKNSIPRPDDWVDTVARFISLGLDDRILTHLIGVSMRKQHVAPDETWAYFCGCCWRTLEDLQGRAHTLVDTDAEHQERGL